MHPLANESAIRAALTATMGNMSMATAKLGATRSELFDTVARSPALQIHRADCGGERMERRWSTSS